MKSQEYKSLKEFISDDYDMVDELIDADLNIGDKFIYGRHMIEKKQDKEIGDVISYFEVIRKKENRIEFVEIIDKLEE